MTYIPMPIKVVRTSEEITNQIAGLNKMKDSLPRINFFGENNWDKIEAQIAILELKKVPNDYYMDEHCEDYVEGDNDLYYEAEYARQWLEDLTAEDLFELEN